MRKTCLNILIFFSFSIIFFFLVTPSYACTINANPNSFSSDDDRDVKITTSDCNFQTSTKYTVFAHPKNVISGGLYANYAVDRKKPQDSRTIIANLNLLDRGIGKSNPGEWTLEVCSVESPLSDCSSQNNIVSKTSIMVEAAQTKNTPLLLAKQTTSPLTPCAQWGGWNGNQYLPLTDDEAKKYFKNGQLSPGNKVKCISVDTAIGTISTEPQAFVRSIFNLILGLAGGIALILIILSGYKFMASQGNPEATKAATEQLTSAIIGLLFIIFAFVILEMIGVDILQIPGFK